MVPPPALRLASAALVLVAAAPLARADNHKWEIAEVFSSADGTVQFVELSNTNKDEHLLAGMQLTTVSGGVFVFPSNLPSSNTENRRVLLGTAAYAAIPGAPAPDYVIPAGFLRRTGDTLTYVSTPDALVFASLPSDGKTSLSGTGAQATNSPTNFAGVSGSIRLATVNVHNGSGVNRVAYSAGRPVIGKPWQVSVDTTPHPGALSVVLFFNSRSSSGIFLTAGEVLYDPTSARLLKFVYPANGGVSNSVMNIPNSTALIGVPATSQALIVGGGREFCNALELVVGW
jgi:hypothetical protein